MTCHARKHHTRQDVVRRHKSVMMERRPCGRLAPGNKEVWVSLSPLGSDDTACEASTPSAAAATRGPIS